MKTLLITLAIMVITSIGQIGDGSADEEFCKQDNACTVTV